MQYDLIYPEDEGQIHDVPCIVAASYFDAEELPSLNLLSLKTERDVYIKAFW